MQNECMNAAMVTALIIFAFSVFVTGTLFIESLIKRRNAKKAIARAERKADMALCIRRIIELQKARFKC